MLRGAKKGNQNARKAVTREAGILIRVNATEKVEIAAAADKAGLSIASFIRLTALKAARGEK